MTNDRRLTWAHRAGAAALAAAGLIVAAPVAVAQVQIPAPYVGDPLAPAQVVGQAFAPQAAVEIVPQVVGRAFPQADGAADAIGDPWWDEAEAKPPPAEQAPDAEAEDAEANEPADAQAMLQAQLLAQVEMLAQSVRQQGLTILRRELSLVRQTCPSLEKPQRTLVLEAGRGAIDRAVDEQTRAAGGRRRPAKRTDLEAAIRDALSAAVQANAQASESAAYAAEQRLRVERRKAAVVATLVAEVDREAYLDAAEREALAKVLTESYRERWRLALTALQQNAMHGGRTVPDESILPGLERCVEKALGKERKDTWVAARDEARALAGAADGQPGVMAFGNGVNVMHGAVQWAAPGQPAVGRIIRRQVQVQVGGGGVQVQVEVQGGVAEAEEAEAEEDENAPAKDEK
jgi:hypothetical protein